METVQEGGISADGVGITSGLSEQAPGQAEAKARIAMGEQPVKRNEGSGENAENIQKGALSSINLSALSGLDNLIADPAGYETYLKQYQDVLGDTPTGYELNPAISGLNLAAIIANAPRGQLLSTILKKENIKDVSDPILQMAQARSKQEQALKLKALDAQTAAKTSAAEQRADLLKTALPKLFDSPDIKQFGNTEAGFYAFNVNDPTQIFELKEGTGVKPTVFGNATTGYGYLDENNNYVQTQEGTGVKPTIFGSDEFVYYYLDDNNKVATAKTGSGKEDQIFGNATTGYFRFDQDTKTAEAIEGAEGTGVQPTEFIQLMDRYNIAQAIINNPDSSSEDIAKAANEMEFLSDKLTTKDPEFTALMNQKADMVFDQTEGTTEDKQNAKNAYIASTIDRFIKGKTDTKLPYNANEALDKEFATLFGKQVEDIRKSADNSKQLSDLSQMATLASENFNTGAFAETRLNIIKMIDAVGGRSFMKGVLSEDQFNGLFNPTDNNVASGELLKAVSSQFAVMMAEAFPGNLNQSEVRLIETAGPNLLVSREGLKVLQEVFDAADKRGQAEAIYTEEFLSNEQNIGLTPEQKYAKYNAGLRQIRAENPVITAEMKARISGVMSEVEGTGESFAVITASGENAVVNNEDKILFDAIKNSPDKATFLTQFNDFIQQNPQYKDYDPGYAYDTYSNLMLPE